MAKILYILKHNPWGIGGGCYACRNYLELFSEIFRNMHIDVLICSEYLKNAKQTDFTNCRFIPVAPRTRFGKYMSPLTGVLHRHNGVAKRMIAENDYDYCIFDHNSIAGSLVDDCRKAGIKTIVLNHNCEQEYFRDNNSRIKNMLLLPVVRKNERHSYNECDYNIFLTEEDEISFRELYGNSKTKCIVGGCFLRKGEKIDLDDNGYSDKENPKIVISGTMGNVQNIDGINYFLDELYRHVPENINVVLTGRNPTEELKEKVAKYNNVTIIENPENILDIVGQCDIFVCPTRLGGGMKLRVIDGLRCGLPVIAHKVSARGYTHFIENGMMRQFESSEEFKNCLEVIVENIKSGKTDRNKIKKEAEMFFCFDSAIEKMNNFLLSK